MARDLRAGWRLAGMRGEIDFLSANQFNGEVSYSVSNGELRRTMTQIYTPSMPTVDADEKIATKRLLDSFPAIESWCEKAESILKIFFKRGQISRVEF